MNEKSIAILIPMLTMTVMLTTITTSTTRSSIIINNDKSEFKY